MGRFGNLKNIPLMMSEEHKYDHTSEFFSALTLWESQDKSSSTCLVTQIVISILLYFCVTILHTGLMSSKDSGAIIEFVCLVIRTMLALFKKWC